MRLIFKTLCYLVQLGQMVKNIKQINKQHNNQTISELTFQIHNLLYKENHVFDAKSQQ